MRWPFLFGRASAAKASPKPQAPTPVREWASLPAIQRVLGEPQLTASTSDFVRSLAGTHDPDLSLEPLGHHVSVEAPPGLVTGIARTVDVYAPSSDLIGRPRPRREAVVQAMTSSPGEPAESTVETQLEPTTMAFPAVDEPVPLHPPLTRMAGPEADTVLRQSTWRPATYIAAASQQQPVSDGPAPETVRAVTAQRLSLGQSRRQGLGAPLPHRPPTVPVQRSVDVTQLDLAPPARTARADHVEAAAKAEVRAAKDDDDQPPAPAAERIAPITGAMVQRRDVTDASDVPPPAELILTPASAAAPFEASRAPDRAVIQRAVASPLPPLFSRPASAPTAPLVSDRPPLLIVRRASGPEEVATGVAQPVMVQRLPAVTPSEPAFGMPPSGIAPAALPTSYPEIATSTNTRSTPALPPLAPVVGTVQRVRPAASDFVAFSPFAAAPRSTTPMPPGSPLLISPVQREMAGGESPTPEPVVASAPVAAAASAGTAAAEAPGQSDKDLDELARKLHDRISLHLRRDLLIQRERAGMVTDLR